MTIPQQRPISDRCPGLLAPHQADDGLLVRLRIPGGQTSVAALTELSRVARTFGQDALQLTSRGNIQIRGLDRRDLEPVSNAVAAAGFLPSASHERVRNIVASPLTGLSGGTGDARPLVAALDQALCAEAGLAALPGRFLFAVDDGRGDVTSLSFDLGVQILDADRALILVGGPRSGFRVASEQTVGTVLSLARRFLQLRAGVPRPPWHVREVDLTALDRRLGPVKATQGLAQPPLGRIEDAASVQVPLSLLTPEQVSAVAEVGSGPVVVTPWRGLVVAGAGDQLGRLTAAGLLADDTSAWSGITACIGSPGCAKSRIDTRRLGTELVRLLPTGSPGVHLVGCERRCGAPSEAHVDLVAPVSAVAALRQISTARDLR